MNKRTKKSAESTDYKWNIEKLRKLARAVKEDEMEIKRIEAEERGVKLESQKCRD